MGAELANDFGNLSGSSGDILPTPTEVTFYSHSYNDPSVSSVKPPNQELVALYFRGRVKVFDYEYNALETLRDC
jgi:hypothetical protein